MCWTEIREKSDIDRLMEEFYGFHDSCIVSINYLSGNFVDDKRAMGCGDENAHTLIMRVDSQFGKRLEMCFGGVRKCCFTGFREDFFCDMYDATLEFRTDLLGKTRGDRLILWANALGFDPKVYQEQYPLNNWYETTYIIANTLKYRYLEEGCEDEKKSFSDST